MNKAAATLFGSLLVATTFLTVGCGDDDRDAFNDVVLPPTATATTTTGTTSTSASTTRTTPAVVALGITLDQGVLAVQPTNASGVILFPAATVSAPPANTNYAGSTFSVSLPGSATGLTLTAPTSSIGTVTGSGTQTVSVTLNASATATQMQDFVRNIRVVSNNAAIAQQSTVTVTATGPNGSGQSSTVTNTGRSVRVQGAAALFLTVDPSQASAPTSNRYRTLQEAVDVIAGQTTGGTPVDNGTSEGRQGSIITLVAGSYTPDLVIKKGEMLLQAGNAPGGTILIGYHTTGATADPDLTGLTISGPNAGNSALSGTTRVTDAILLGGISIGAPNVKLDGFTVRGGGTNSGDGTDQKFPVIGVDVNVDAHDVTVQNLVVDGPGAAVTYAYGVTTSGLGVAPNNANLRVLGCTVQNWTAGVFLYGEAEDTTNARRGSDVVSGNLFTGNYQESFEQDNGDNAVITGNVSKLVSGQALHLSFYNNTAVRSTNNTVTGNDFDLTGNVDLSNTSTGGFTINLTNNWWGTASGPATAPTPVSITSQYNSGSATAALNTANTTPFLTVDPFPGF